MKILVTRKNIKNMYLRVDDHGNVLVSCPRRTTDKQIMDFVRSREAWIQNALLIEELRKTREPEYLEHPELKEAARKELRARLEERVPLMEARTGLKSSGWTIRDMKSRWGSCNVQTRRITFNLRLVNKTDKELDYIILHELCHIKERYHNNAFWSLVSKYMPDWRDARNSLRTK